MQIDGSASEDCLTGKRIPHNDPWTNTTSSIYRAGLVAGHQVCCGSCERRGTLCRQRRPMGSRGRSEDARRDGSEGSHGGQRFTRQVGRWLTLLVKLNNIVLRCLRGTRRHRSTLSSSSSIFRLIMASSSLSCEQPPGSASFV